MANDNQSLIDKYSSHIKNILSHYARQVTDNYDPLNEFIHTIDFKLWDQSITLGELALIASMYDSSNDEYLDADHARIRVAERYLRRELHIVYVKNREGQWMKKYTTDPPSKYKASNQPRRSFFSPMIP